ncbi:MAG TPA: glycoside hydrolase family 3 C-terminal domain-containing protein [Opitutaceae bacterium]
MSYATPVLTLTAFLFLGGLVASAESLPAYRDPSLPVEKRIDDLISRLTLSEKIGIVHAAGTFRSGSVPRLGVPYLYTDDGPQGVREEVGVTSWGPTGQTDDYATAMPPGATVAATWDPALIESMGQALGEECCARGKNVLLAPGVNIARTPLCGRNYDYYGEDPWLTSRIAVAYIRGLQERQTVACVKHFALNNQEVMRGTIDVDVDERALREIYLPAFEASVREGGVLSIMGAYNQFRGQHCAENDYLLNQVLKGEWGFRGAVISDWGAVHDTREAAMNGCDLEMGSGPHFDDYYLARAFEKGVQDGTYPMAVLDDKVRRNLRMLYATGVMDGRSAGSLNTPEHLAVSRQVAQEAMVLLKNDGALLPIDPTRCRSIAVIGENAVRTFAAGGNSAGVKAFRETTALAGILERAGDKTNVVFSVGYRQPIVHLVWPRDKAGVARTELTAMSPEEQTTLADRAIAAARSSDLVIFVGGLIHQATYDDEGTDRRDLSLPAHQSELISRLAAVNPHLVVVLIDGSPVEMGGWLKSVPAVLQAWYGGSEAGRALASVLFGDVNPSGRLPITFPQSLEQTPTYAGGARAYPGVKGVVHYDEGLLVGYRWYDTKNLKPLFPFGYGLSYTSFAYSDLKVVSAGADAARVECTVKNTGDRAGAEVVELYVHDGHAPVPRPVKELKAFAKVTLAPGESKVVTLELGPRAFAYYSTGTRHWTVDGGDFDVQVGGSSRDLPLSGTVRVANAQL